MAGKRYISHFFDEASKKNFIFSVPDKKQTTLMQNFKEMRNLARTQYKFDLRIIFMDHDRSLRNELKSFVLAEGYQLSHSATYTPEQNGTIKRSRGVIIARSTAMKRKLPIELWPEIYSAAGYLLNRSPTRSIDWETPDGFLAKASGMQSQKPSLAHLRVYGCRAYVHIPNRPRLDKLEPKAEVGYLVGYESTNIFRIWIPSRDVIVASRDVTFSETIEYDPALHLPQAEPLILV